MKCHIFKRAHIITRRESLSTDWPISWQTLFSVSIGVLQEFKNGGHQWCNSSCTPFFGGELSPLCSLNAPDGWLSRSCSWITASNWPARCAPPLTSIIINIHEEKKLAAERKPGPASLDYSYRRGFAKMTCRPYDYSWDGSNQMAEKKPFPAPPPMICTSNNESLIHKCTVSKLPFLLPD